jgi:hypothetical protein
MVPRMAASARKAIASKQYRLISERQNQFLDRHPEYLEAARARRRRLVARDPFFDPQHGANTNVVLRASDA